MNYSIAIFGYSNKRIDQTLRENVPSFAKLDIKIGQCKPSHLDLKFLAFNDYCIIPVKITGKGRAVSTFKFLL